MSTLDTYGYLGIRIDDKVKQPDRFNTPSYSKSDFYPIQTRGKQPDTFQKSVENDLVVLARFINSIPKHCQNLTKGERELLKNLQGDTNIVIKTQIREGWWSYFTARITSRRQVDNSQM